ncbi:MAG: sigma-54 dependent transcriptional regulator [Candidatus Latescibacterota bacterium]
MMSEKILVVEDDQTFRLFMTEALKKSGYQVEEATTVEDALQKIKQCRFDLIIMDVRLQNSSGIEAMERIKQIDPQAIIIIMTAYGSKEVALEAVKQGAYDYFTKPFKIDEMSVVVRRALERRRLQEEIRSLQAELSKRWDFSGIAGQSDSMRDVLELVRKVAPTETTVLIGGESGTGKELVASALHTRSRRADKPFIKLNCVAIPEGLLESELFGHEKGAFTGAVAQKLGKFELAHQGTILLDEIGDMSPPTQAKVLRVLEEREFERVGGTRTIKVDVRVIAATNRDLTQAVKERMFREDLYFRLNVVSINLPPLRQRKEDIPLLAEHFLHESNLRLQTQIKGISREAMSLLLNYQWPGNVRELRNVIDGASVIAEGDTITTQCLPPSLQQSESLPALPEASSSLEDTVAEMEKRIIIDALKEVDGIQSKAARKLGIKERSLWHKVKKYGIDIYRIKKPD